MNLEDLIDPARHRVRLASGYATDTTGVVMVGGVPVPAFWMGHVSAQENDALWILFVDRPDAPSLAVVVGVNGPATPETMRPIHGTVAAAPIGSDTISVMTSVGAVDAAFPATYTPAVSDPVRLLWQGGNAWVLGKSAKVPDPPAATVTQSKPDIPSPPSGAGSGRDTFTASNSGTWSTGTGSWNSYFGKDLYQGSYGAAGANRGAWFYHGKPTRLRGKWAVGVEIWIPKRLRAGSYNSAVTLNLFTHGSAKRPGGDVSRGEGADLVIPAGFKGGWRNLPDSFGQALIDGGGVGMSGGTYAGFVGVDEDPKSGQIRIAWEG